MDDSGVLDQEEMWRLWRAGSSISDLCRRVNRPPGSIFTLLARRGGYSGTPGRRRSGHLWVSEREEIWRGLARRWPACRIAAGLGRAASTISREISRNGGRAGYRAVPADRGAWAAARRGQPTVLATHTRLRRLVADRLAADWSPQQISGWLAAGGGQGRRVSGETIYKSLLAGDRPELDYRLTRHRRTRRTIRRGHNASRHTGARGGIIGGVSIALRPGQVDGRAQPGHCQADLAGGARGTQIATLVERTSRFVVMIGLPNRKAVSVAAAIGGALAGRPGWQRRSITFDRGPEFAAGRQVSLVTGMDCYFADPHCRWQRGSNENLNGLIRQYFPKGSVIPTDQAAIDAVAERLNTRPRRILAWATPADMLTQAGMH